MLIKQLSVFVENKPGRLAAVIEALGKNNINISALSLADTSEYGILRIIVNDPELASEVLNDCNQYCKEDTGMLIASSYIHSDLDKGKLIWQTPYAKKQYWDIRTAYKTVNPGASWRWCEVAKKKHLKQWEIQAQRLVGK